MRVKRRRRMTLVERYLRENYKVICIALCIAGVLCSGLGLLILPERWWVFPAGGAAAFAVLEVCHYIQRFGA